MESESNMDAFCRLCGSEEGIKVSIFDPGAEHVKKIHKILPITVNEHDSLPKSMCHRCSFKVNEFFEFRINCIRAQDVFKSKLPWLKHKKNSTSNVDDDYQPMVELPMNSINFISPSERHIPTGPGFIDENDPMIVIDDDSPPYKEVGPASLQDNVIPQEKIIMKIKRSELKKRTKPKSIWESKKRRRRTYNSCRITEVFTTTVDEYERIGDVENDPLDFSAGETNGNNYSNQIFLDDNYKTEQDLTRKGNLTSDKSGDSIQLPKYILVTKIPRVGSVYTCEKCGRTFLSPQPASLHTCDDVDTREDHKFKDKDPDTSSNSVDFYNCNECNQIFSRQSQLIAHKKKHNEAASTTDDSVLSVNRRTKHRRKNKVKLNLSKTVKCPQNRPQIETGIIRHSLLSSESDSD